MERKRCAHCKIEKLATVKNFRFLGYYHKTKNPKWFAVCRDCVSLYNKKYREKNCDKIKEKKKEYYSNTLEQSRIKRKEYRELNKDIIREKKREWKKKRKKENPQFWLKERISCAIYLALLKRKSKKNGKSIADFLPYTIEELKNHLESKFEPWMNWDNHGTYDRKTWDDNDSSTWTWQIDHIIPQSKFSYTSMEDEGFQKAWALENLRPYPAKHNIIEQANR